MIICSVISLYSGQRLDAEPLTAATFPAAYRQAEEKLYLKYVVNRRTQYRFAVNHSTTAGSQLGENNEFMNITGEKFGRTNYLTPAPPR